MPGRELAQAERNLEAFFAAKSADEPVVEKLRREAELLVDGTVSGVRASLADAADNPWQTAAKMGVAAAVGLGLGLAQGRAGMFRLGAQVLGLSMTYGFMKDVYSRAGITGDAIADTWRTGANLERNKAVFAGTVGPFIVDSGLMAAGGLAGARISRIPSVYSGFHRTLDHIQGFDYASQHAQLRNMMLEHHPGTAHHQDRVGELSRRIASQMGQPPAVVEKSQMTGALHDTGKLQTRLDVLDNPGRLEGEALAHMRDHAIKSERILEGLVEYPPRLKDVPSLAGAHHEALNGQGYPRGLAGDEIKIETRINTVADVVDATAAARSYKGPMELPRIYAILADGRATRFDPAVVDAFLRLPADRTLGLLFSEAGRMPAVSFSEFKGMTIGSLMLGLRSNTLSLSPAMQAYFRSKYNLPVKGGH